MSKRNLITQSIQRPYKDLVNVMMSKRIYTCDEYLELCKQNKYSRVEYLWRNTLFGIRVNACALMWITLFITNRPVLYIFKNITTDIQKTRYNALTKVYTDNVHFIKNIIDKFNDEIKQWCTENDFEYLKKYKFPALKTMEEFDVNTNNIYCCIVNNNDLMKLNELFTKLVEQDNKLIDITILFDDCEFGDIFSTQFEPLLFKLYKNVCNVYILQKQHEFYKIL